VHHESEGITLEYSNLDRFFYPRGIAIVDADSSDRGTADDLLKTVIQRFSRGPVVRINAAPGADLAAQFAEKGKGIDLAAIAAPPDRQAELACACDDAGIRAALLMNPMRREPIPSDGPLDATLLQQRCHHGLRVLGPMSFGLISPHHDLNLTLGLPMPRVGNTAFISESSAMASAVLDWSFRTGVGFSAMVACDRMPDVSWADLITHFGDDPQTKSIVMYMESVGDARAFLSAAREVALNKPIILLKSRRSAEFLAGDETFSADEPRPDFVFDAALRRVGVLRVRSISELFYMANILARQPLPKGPRLAIITNSTTPAMLATDSLWESGGALAQLSDETSAALRRILPEGASAGNPVDILGDADAERYAATVSAVATDKNVDGLLLILTPQPITQPTATARALVDLPGRADKPVLASWMGADQVAEGQDVMYRAGIPAFPYPDTPARLFSLMWRHAQNLNGIYETPSVIEDEERAPVDADAAAAFLRELRAQGITVLDPDQSAKLLRLYGIMVQPDKTPPDDAYKLLVGSRIDKAFGPYMVFGIGGRMSAIYEDIALGLPPLTSALAHRMMESSAVWRVLKPGGSNDLVSRNRVVKLQALVVRLSLLVVQQPAIRRLTINPLFVSGDDVLISHASVNLHNPSVAEADFPRPAIRPYPMQYTWQETVRTGLPVIIRPVRPEDEPLIVEFHKLLSEETIYRRYFFQHKFSRRTSHERLRRTCFLDFDREIALAALLPLENGSQGVAAVGRLARNRVGDSAEFALLVADPYQGLGIGTSILRHLVDIARAEGVSRLVGTMLPANIHMQHLFGKLGFEIRPGADDTVVAELVL
jgi:acetyltransferase